MRFSNEQPVFLPHRSVIPLSLPQSASVRGRWRVRRPRWYPKLPNWDVGPLGRGAGESSLRKQRSAMCAREVDISSNSALNTNASPHMPLADLLRETHRLLWERIAGRIYSPEKQQRTQPRYGISIATGR